jgi:magnesium transporter
MTRRKLPKVLTVRANFLFAELYLRPGGESTINFGFGKENQSVQTAMLSIYRWNADTKQGEWQEVAALPKGTAADLAANEIWWIDLDDPSEEEEAAILGRFLKVHSLTLEDITKPRREPNQGSHLPKAEEFHDYLFVIVNPLRPDVVDGSTDGAVQPLKRGGANLQLSVVLTRNVLITHHLSALASISEVKQFLYRHTDGGARGPDYLFHLILDAMVDQYAPVVDRVSDDLDAAETRLFDRNPTGLLPELLRLKRSIVSLRKTLILEREVLMRLMRGDFNLVDERERVYYRNVYDHLVRYAELVESAREMVSDLMQSHMAAMSNRLNQIMKVLAMISTVVLPMTLIAGIYGMNFKQMPELEWTLGYPFALGLMGLTAIVAVVYFRWRKWI